MSLSAGTRLGPYEVLAPLGKGGMGEVYRARDTKLDRDVAIKVLPAALADDPERLARFEREAKVLASLNHPNIAQIYGVEQGALVMELVEGDTLAGPLPVTTAIGYARQIAEALEAAHEKGIVHRDLKPANVKVTPQGMVKVLDFGLAAVMQSAASRSDASNSPTLTMAATQLGTLLGTAGYMSPEQAAGKPVDRRADNWSFGVVLWELLTGSRLFDGETVSHTLAAVLTKDPDWQQLPEGVPASVRKLLKRCLERDLRRRLPDIGSARLELEDAISGKGGEVSPPPARSGGVRQNLPWVWAVIATLALLALGVAYFRRPEEDQRMLKLSVPLPDKARFPTGTDTSLPALSPDGRRLAFVVESNGHHELWVRDLDSLTARPLPGTEGANDPFWSPDGRVLGFFGGGGLKKIDVNGGPAVTLSDAPLGRGATWSKDDVILFAPAAFNGLVRIPAAGGNATPVTSLDSASLENSHRYPCFLPDGRHFLYTARAISAEKTAIYLGDLASKTRRLIISAASNAVYAPPGYLLYLRGQTLMAQRFDPTSAQIAGEPIPVAQDVDYVAGNQQGQFAASQNGTLVYIVAGSGGGAQLTWFDRSGKITGAIGLPGDLQRAAISPDGALVAEDRADPQTGLFDIWVHSLARGTKSRFTFGPRTSDYPVWSPDGSHIAFRSTNVGGGDIFQKASSGVARDEVLDRGESRIKVPADWSRDGRYLIEDSPNNPKTGFDIWVLPLFGDRKPFPYLQTEFNERNARLSPDGRWLAYESDESRRWEVYVQTFPAPGGKWQVSTDGAAANVAPVWSRDGKELFFVGVDQKLMTVAVKSGAQFEPGVPQPLFDTHIVGGFFAAFDVSKDGHFLMPAVVEQAATAPMTVVVNWQAGLKK